MAVIAPTPIDAGPIVPSSADSETTFDAAYEAFNTWEKTKLQPQANALATNVYNNARAAEEGARVAELAADRAALSSSDVLTASVNAVLSASAANTAKLAAEAALDSFDDRYLGAKSIPPTTDNDGNPLMVGALYWSAATSEMKAWSGTAWVVAYGNLGSKYDKTGGTITGNVLVQQEVNGTASIDVSNTDGVGLNAAAGLTLRTGVAAIGYMHLFKLLNELQIGTSTPTSVGVYINGGIALRVGTDKSILATSGALGYGVGAGGAVTQPTSKSTLVTLNKPSGRITTAADSLAAGGIASFALSNSFIAQNDVLALGVTGGYNQDAYLLRARTFAGGAIISIVNQTTGALADAIQFQFLVLKGAVS